jgi:hypothetical protein
MLHNLFLFESAMAGKMPALQETFMMLKSKWIEVLEWCVLAFIGLLLAGILIQRSEIISTVQGDSFFAESVEE